MCRGSLGGDGGVMRSYQYNAGVGSIIVSDVCNLPALSFLIFMFVINVNISMRGVARIGRDNSSGFGQRSVFELQCSPCRLHSLHLATSDIPNLEHLPSCK